MSFRFDSNGSKYVDDTMRNICKYDNLSWLIRLSENHT